MFVNSFSLPEAHHLIILRLLKRNIPVPEITSRKEVFYTDANFIFPVDAIGVAVLVIHAGLKRGYRISFIYACQESGDIVFFIESSEDIVSDIQNIDDMTLRLNFDTFTRYISDITSLTKEALEYVYEHIPKTVKAAPEVFEKHFSRFYEKGLSRQK
jgi:hypothetical protein